MSKSIRQPKINATLEDLTKDIKITKDPIKKAILEKFFALKISEMRSETDDPIIDDLSVGPAFDELSESEDKQLNQTENKIISKNRRKVKTADIDPVENEYVRMMRKQEDSLTELDKMSRIKAYAELMEDNKIDSDKKVLEKTRGGREKVWQVHETYDPKYIKYQKDDVMNNKLMERLNSEIDFRSDADGTRIIEKPFNDGDPDNTEEFARYEQTPNEVQKTNESKKTKYIPKKTNQLGKKRPLYK